MYKTTRSTLHDKVSSVSENVAESCYKFLPNSVYRVIRQPQVAQIFCLEGHWTKVQIQVIRMANPTVTGPENPSRLNF
jgi:hypothetical protein